MTPEEAMKGKFAAEMSEDDRAILKLMLDWIKESETWRCAARVRQCCGNEYNYWEGNLSEKGRSLADDILTTGGLEAVE